LSRKIPGTGVSVEWAVRCGGQGTEKAAETLTELCSAVRREMERVIEKPVVPNPVAGVDVNHVERRKEIVNM
jgi:hypothetical protein